MDVELEDGKLALCNTFLNIFCTQRTLAAFKAHILHHTLTSRVYLLVFSSQLNEH